MFTRRAQFPLLIFICVITLSNVISARTFTSAEGVTIQAELISVDARDRATIRRNDGRLFRDVSIEFFSDADRKYIRQWKQDQLNALNKANITEDSRVRISVGTSRDTDFNEYGDIDDQLIKFKPKISFYNEEMKETFTDVSGTLVLIGEHVLDRNVMGVLYKEDFKTDIPPKEKIEWNGKAFMSRYDPDYGGFRYEGYLLIVRDQKNKVVRVRASKSIWEDNFQKILRAEVDTAYDRKFETQAVGYRSY